MPVPSQEAVMYMCLWYQFCFCFFDFSRFAPGFVNYKKWCTRLAAASDKVYQLLANGRWFSQGTPASSTTKTGRHDIAEILLKVALNTKTNQIDFSIRFLNCDVKVVLLFNILPMLLNCVQCLI